MKTSEYLDVSHTSIQVNDSTHYNKKVNRKYLSVKHHNKSFFNAYSQMTFTWTVWLSTSPKPLYAAQLKVPESFLLIFFIVSTFPSCNTPVFPWFPVFSLVQVTFGSGLPNASHVNCKLLPSWTVCSPPISVISAGTKSRKSHWKKNWIHFKDNS